MASAKEDGVQAVLQRFPTRREAIEALAQESESFRDICDELVSAERALATVDHIDEPARAERRLEWLCFIRGAWAEIEAELQRVNVIPIDRGGRRLR